MKVSNFKQAHGLNWYLRRFLPVTVCAGRCTSCFIVPDVASLPLALLAHSVSFDIWGNDP